MQRVKTALVNRLFVFGGLKPQFLFGSAAQEVRYFKLMLWGKVSDFPAPPDPSVTMPKEELPRMAEAMRRAFPELIKLDRHERRVAARRDRAMREISKGYNLKWTMSLPPIFKPKPSVNMHMPG